MRVLFIYYDDGTVLTKNLPDKYCTPKVLVAVAIICGCLFLTCSKYGCRQFLNPLDYEKSKK